MSDRTRGQSTFSKYAKGLLLRPTAGGSYEGRGLETAPARSTTQSLSFAADAAISAIAASPDRKNVVIAGREVLKVLTLGRYEILEKVNLHVGNRQSLNYSSNDVKWGTGATAGIITTATSNGTIVIWNLETASSQKVDRIISGHNRAVNKLDFNPGNGSWLLSASQDGSMKLWDLRDREGSARFVLHGKAEAVRDVQFNSTNALEVAAVYDNGTLQKWDLRNPKIYERKLNAHNGPALALSWHADGRHLVTGGRDKVIKVWDLDSEVRRPVRYLHTMAPIAKVAWRPASAGTNYDQIASSSFSMDNLINIWDLRRPYIPDRLFETHAAAPTGLMWKDSNTIWSCSKDHTFRQQPLDLAVVTVDCVSHYAFGWSNNDDIAICIGNRQADKDSEKARVKNIIEQKLVPPPEVATEVRKGQKGRSSPVQGTAVAALNPKATLFRPLQSFAIVHAEIDACPNLFRHLAVHFSTSGLNAIQACAHNALVAHKAQQAGLSKSWKLLKLALEHLGRARKQRPFQRKSSMDKSLTASRLGDSLIRRDIERLRLTSHLSESGHSTMRGSPVASLIMPRYTDAVPSLSLPASRIPSRPGTADLLEDTTRIQESQSQRPLSANGGTSNPDKVILPKPGSECGRRQQDSNDIKEGSEARLWSLQTRQIHNEHEASPASIHELVPVDRETPESKEGNDVPNSSAVAEQEVAVPIVGADDEEIANRTAQSMSALAKTTLHILASYQEQGNVQVCATVCLVLGDLVSLPKNQMDDWVYCYIELLQRQRLFTTATEVINNTTSEVVRALAEGDIIMHTSCGRCKKAIPAVREHGSYWMCTRCQNTVLCIVCGVVVRGVASWCRVCAHAAHHACRQAISTEFGGTCVAPDCTCACYASR